MELKVWVEGIQRIICGVTMATSTSDVVYALAHATGKTGRFTLIERWRNSERLLAPNEQPLKVLLKWGEHSNDVQFILQWAPLDSGGAAKQQQQQQQQQQLQQLDSSSSSQNESNLFAKNSSTLTSSSNSPSSINTNTNSSTLSKHNKSTPFSSNVGNLPSADQTDKIGSSSSASSANSTMMTKKKESVPSVGVVRGVVQRGGNNNESLVNNPSSTINTDNNISGKVISTTNNSGVNNSSANNKILSAGENNSNNSSSSFETNNIMDRSQGKNLKDLNLSSPPPYRDPPNIKGLAHSPLGLSSPANNKGLPPYREPPPPNLNRGSGSGSPVVQLNHHQQQNLLNGDITTTSSHQNGSMPISPAAAPIPTSTTTTNSNSQYQELVRLINLQREKLTAQHAEMTQFDAEIMFWEGRAREQQRNLEFITKEISRLEAVSAQQESQVLSLIHLEEENELAKHQSEQLKAEIEGLRTEFSNCEKEINLCKNKMGVLTNELHMQHVSMQQRQEEWMQREANTLSEIDRLKKELLNTRRETDVVSDMSGTLEAEVSNIEADLAGKKKQMERLINAMKEANLQSLTIQPPDELLDGGTHHRSGSTRRMIGSPRQLENAPSTKQNPHGVWV